MSASVIALGHRFPNLDVEQEVLGPDVVLVDGTRTESLAEAMASAKAVLVGTLTTIDAGLLDRLPSCEIVVRYGIGADNVDMAEAARRGIGVANVPDYCLDEVSDHAMALVLVASRRLFEARRAARSGAWTTQALSGTRRLSTQTLGLVGYGRIGRSVAHKARAFGLRVLVSDPFVSREAAAADGTETCTFDELLMASDFVSLHCPLTPATRGLIGTAALARMKPTAWLINTSRGGLVDLDALLAALDVGALAGAGLDVLPEEPPPPGHPVLDHERVVVTPHVAWFSTDAVSELRMRAARTVALVLEGGWPGSILNGIKGPRRTGGTR